MRRGGGDVISSVSMAVLPAQTDGWRPGYSQPDFLNR